MSELLQHSLTQICAKHLLTDESLTSTTKLSVKAQENLCKVIKYKLII